MILDQCEETGEVYRLKGKTDIPRGNYIVPDADEDWDFGMDIVCSYKQNKFDKLYWNKK